MPRRFHMLLCFLLFPAMAGSASKGHRLVSASPELTELLFQLGKGKDIVATSALSEYPAQAKEIPELGPLFMPSIERTARLSPDWVLLDESNLNPAYERAVAALRIPSLKVKLTSLDLLFRESERLLARVYGEHASAPLTAAKRCAASLKKPADGATYLAFVWLSPPVLAGHATFLSDVLSKVAGTNTAPAAWQTPYPQVSEEWLLLHPVDTIYFLAELPDARETAERLARGWWPGRDVRRVPLQPAHFARASLTPLLHLDEITKAPGAFGKECLELAQ